MNVTIQQVRLMEEVKGRLVLTLKATSDIVEATVQTITATLAAAFKEPGMERTSFADTITGAARGCIRGVTQGGGDLSDAATGIVLGVMRGHAGTTKLQVTDAIRQVAQVVIRETSMVGGNLGSASRGLIQGAVLGAKEANLDVDHIAAVAADGALKGARQIGSGTFDTVRMAVIKALPRRQPRLNRENVNVAKA